MAAVTIYHNPRCSNSRTALAIAEERGIEVAVVRYLQDTPDRATLEGIVAVLEDPVEDLVRRDARFAELGLDAAHYVGDPGAVVGLLVEHPELLQRPVLVRGGRAVIGRPRERVEAFLT
jgi:arsenate reductase (glutaredoxin)